MSVCVGWDVVSVCGVGCVWGGMLCVCGGGGCVCGGGGEVVCDQKLNTWSSSYMYGS